MFIGNLVFIASWFWKLQGSYAKEERSAPGRKLRLKGGGLGFPPPAIGGLGVGGLQTV